jgi:hypothetical protein
MQGADEYRRKTMQMTGVAHHEAFLACLQSTYVDCRCAQHPRSGVGQGVGIEIRGLALISGRLVRLCETERLETHRTL